MTTTQRDSDTTPVSAGRVLPRAVRWCPVTEFLLRVYRRSWRGSLFSGFLSPLLYLGSLGYGLGSLVDDGRGTGVGVPYAGFVAPGLLAANAMQAAVGESTYPVLGAVKWQRQYHAAIATPLTVADVLFGHAVFIVLRVLLVTASFVAVGALLGAFTSPWVLVAALVAVLCGAVHAVPIMGFAVGRDDDSAFAALLRFVVVPMFLFAGTFFPVAQLPPVLRPVAWVTPLWHATELSRDLCLGTVDALAAVGHTGYLLLWLAAGAWYAVRAYTKRLVD
jgi:lipooligosaccharide transport system permease protein